MLWFLADDSEEMSRCKDFDSVHGMQPGKGKMTFEEQYDVINSTYFSILTELSHFIVNTHLRKYHYESFEIDKYNMECWFMISKYGQDKLKKEHPDIWQELSLDDYV